MPLSFLDKQPAPLKRSRPAKKLQYFVTGLGVLMVLYTIAGFAAAPALVEHFLPKLFAEHLGLKAAVRQVRVNPLVFSIRLNQFTAAVSDDRPLLEFDTLYVNFQLLSLVRRTFDFKEISLQGLQAQAEILEDGRLNFSPLLDKLSENKGTDAVAAEIPPVSVGQLSVDGARLTFRDLSHATPYEAVVFPATFSLHDFSTVAGSGNRYRFHAALATGGSFNGEGDLSLSPVGARGRVRVSDFNIPAAWAYVKDWVRFEITQGFSDVELEYEVTLDDGQPRLVVKNTSVEFTELRVAAKGSREPVFSLPSLTVGGVSADTGRKSIQIDSVASRGARLKGWLNPDGSLGLLSVFALEPFEGSQALLSEAAEDSERVIHKWQVDVRQILLEDNALHYEDRTIDEPFRLALEPIQIEVNNFTNRKNTPTRVSVSVADRTGGSVTVTGNTIVRPLSSELNVVVDNMSLAQFEPYLRAVANIDIGGRLRMQGRIAYAVPTRQNDPNLRFAGRFGIADLKAVDLTSGEPVFMMQDLGANGIDVSLEPNRMNISEVVIRKPQTDLRIDPAGNLNVKAALKRDSEGAEEIKRSLLGKLAQAILTRIKGPMPLRIDRIRIEEAGITTADHSIQPPFSLQVESLTANITGIDSDRKAEASVGMDGVIGREAPLKAAGRIEPFGAAMSARMSLSLENFDITPLSPYSGKYAGYTLEKGRLSLSLAYTLSQKKVNGTNDIFLEKLTLGERVDSPDAVNLPIELAIALMKDRDDNIRLNVPIRGDLDDPDFQIVGILANTLVTLITSVVTTPFAVLGSIAGALSAEELRAVAFDPGSDALAAVEKDQLAQLTAALRQRPALQLEITATADKTLDRQALSGGEAEAETAASDENLRNLARRRAKSIAELLIRDGGVAAERISVVIELIEAPPAANQVDSVLAVAVP